MRKTDLPKIFSYKKFFIQKILIFFKSVYESSSSSNKIWSISGYFEINENGCTLDNPLALPYALSILTQGGSKKISLIGFDGYKYNDIRASIKLKINNDFGSSLVEIKSYENY